MDVDEDGILMTTTTFDWYSDGSWLASYVVTEHMESCGMVIVRVTPHRSVDPVLEASSHEIIAIVTLLTKTLSLTSLSTRYQVPRSVTDICYSS
jgi:hypothetical protein